MHVSEDLIDAPVWTPVPPIRMRAIDVDAFDPLPGIDVDAPPPETEPLPMAPAPLAVVREEVADEDSTMDRRVPVRRTGAWVALLLGGGGLLVATALAVVLLVGLAAGVALFAVWPRVEVVPTVVSVEVAEPVAAPAPIVAVPVPVPVAPVAAPAAPAKPVRTAPKVEVAPVIVEISAETPISGAEVTVAGDAAVVLVGDAGRFPLPGRVPAGRYAIEATFGDEPVVVDRIEVREGVAAVVRCNARMEICRAG